MSAPFSRIAVLGLGLLGGSTYNTITNRRQTINQ